MAPRKGCREVSGMVPPSHPRPPVDPSLLNGDAEEMWSNLGDWRGATPAAGVTGPAAYRAAARALATRVAVAAALGPTDVVVDYACGFGDSLRLWVETFGVRRAIGVEPDPRLCAALRARISRWGLDARLAVVTSRAEACAPTVADAHATAVVCVDAAYHFRTRLAWWRMLMRTLPAGGRIAVSDLVLGDGRRAGPATRGIARVVGIPHENLTDAATLAADLRDVGARDIHIERAGRDVLDGFIHYGPRRSIAVGLTRAGLRALRLRLDYVVLSGRAPGA